MIQKKLLQNEEAVSVSVGFILMFAITVIVFSALIISFYSLLQHSEKSATTEIFKTLGEGLAVKITIVDTLIYVASSNGGIVNDLQYEFSLPESISSKSYSINITNSTGQIIMESDNGARTGASYNISTNFTGRRIYSGDGNYVLKFNNNDNNMFID